MQIYTKILIGMAVGAVIGLTLGPSSLLLSKDTLKIDKVGELQFASAPDATGTALAMPESAGGHFDILEYRSETMIDALGETQEVPRWVRVQFKFSKRLGLLDRGDVLRGQLGDPKTGERVEAWIGLNTTPLDSGGFALYPDAISGLGDSVIAILAPIGSLFMRLLKMVIVPLVFSSLLVGVASLGDVRKLGRMGGRTLGLYLVTTSIAVSIGLVCAHVIAPGNFIDEAARARLQAQYTGAADSRVEQAAAAPSMVDNVLAIVPENPIEALGSGNMLQIIFFALVFGIALTLLEGTKAEPVVRFFDRVQEAMIVVIHMVMAFAPYGVAALIAEVVGLSGVSVLASLLLYAVAVLIGLAIHLIFVYGGIVRFLTRLKVGAFLRGIRPAQLIAFSTSSSSAALPVTMECAEDNLNISKPVSSFVLPLGSTVNMDGTALYQGVAAIFIAQVFQIDLSLGAQLGIVLTATMASIGAAGVPGAGIVTLALVLTATGIPAVGVALVLGMDRLVDMFRTAVNVTGDLAVASAMATAEGENLQVLSDKEDRTNPDKGFEHRLDRPEHSVEPD